MIQFISLKEDILIKLPKNRTEEEKNYYLQVSLVNYYKI